MENKRLYKISSIFIVCCILMYAGDVLFWCHLPIRIKDSGLTLTFNSMIDHLLHGKFDVDPDIVGKEGFLRDGHVYAYWGIFPALLRLPVIFLPNGLHIDVTRLSCVIAAIFMFLINLKSLKYVTANTTPASSWVRKSLLFAIAFSGVQICFLRPSLYQEVCLWALVFGMMFVHWSLRACLDAKQIPKALIWMSVASVGALLTRVSMGIGTYGAECLFGIIVLWLHLNNFSKASEETIPRQRYQYVIAAAILVVGILLTAGINFERWGNPFTFANYNLYLFNAEYPDRIARTAHYGLFNIQRIPFGLIYFFFPLWAVRNGNHLIFQDLFTRLLDAVELPPSSFFLTDGVFLLFGAIFIYSLVNRSAKCRSTDIRISSCSIILGLAVPAVLMLMAISMNYRYRAEFYPLIMFLGFMGISCVSVGEFNKKWLKTLCITLVVIGIIFSNAILIIYNLSQHGPALELITDGIPNYYLSRFWHLI